MQNKYQASPSYTQDLDYSISEAKSKGSTWKDMRYSTLKGNTEYDDSNIKDKIKVGSENDDKPIDPTVYKDAIKSLRDELTRLRGGPANQVNDGNQYNNLKSEQRLTGKLEEYKEKESEYRESRENPLDISKKELDTSEKLKIQNNQNQRERVISPKIYKSPNEKDEIDKSYHHENNSRSSVKSSESKQRPSERNLQSIPKKIAEIEKELDDQINQVDEYLVNKDLIKKKHDHRYDEERELEEASAKKSQSNSNSDALETQKKLYKDAFEKNQRRLQEEESKIEYKQIRNNAQQHSKYVESDEEDENPYNVERDANVSTSKTKNLTELYFETQLNRLRAENDRLNDELDQHLKNRRTIDFQRSSKVWRNQEQEFESAEEMAQYRNTMNAKSRIASDHSNRDQEIRAIADRARSQLRKKLEKNAGQINHKINADSVTEFKFQKSIPKISTKRKQKEANFLLCKGIPTKYSSDRNINNLIWRNIN